MNEKSDIQLLRDYAERGNEVAFREIVTRHTDFVYSSALRQMDSADLAADITQKVFVDLARKAGTVGKQLAAEASLAGWLHRATRYAALNHLRDDRRRHTNERQAMEQLLTNSESSVDWQQIRPALDEALDSLGDEDREALLLRYIKNQDFRAVGRALGVSDDTAQKRVSRAVERLREFYSKRNITVGAGGLAVLISANAVQSAPIGLAVAISTAALAGTAASTSAAVAATKIIAMTTLQKAIIGTALVAAVGTGVFEAHQNSKLRDEIQTLQQQQASQAEQLQQLRRERDEATNQLAGLLGENEQLKSNQNTTELLKLRGEVTRLQDDANSATDVAAKAWLARVNQLEQWSEQNPAATIPEFQFLTQQDWLNAAQKPLNTDADYRRAMSSLRSAAENEFASKLRQALGKYTQANNGQFPTDLGQLQSFFDSPVDGAILQRWEIVSTKTVPNIGVGGPDIITERTAVDDLLDTRIAIGGHGYGSTDFLGSEIGDAMKPVYTAYSDAHGENWTGFNVSNLLDFAKTPEQQAAVQKLIAQQQLRSAP